MQVARAGRFGTKGLAITFVSDEGDAKVLNDVQERFEVNISELPDEIDISSYSKLLMKLLMSRLMGKPTICIGENKDADQLRGNREADRRLCFRYSDSTIPLLLKSEISSF